ncbi:MAG: MarR family transcriptional regulator, partial [Firmicutes bacterium]|nr:MarR family transcriptional regulator [Bacillota bacterium]
MNRAQPKQFREQIRILERKLGLLKKNNGSYCAEVLTLAQCHALVEIGRIETISLKELSVILAIDMSTTSRTVDGLVKKGYVLRIPSLE